MTTEVIQIQDPNGTTVVVVNPNAGTLGGGDGGGAWGTITGTLSAQTDLNTALGLRVLTSTTVNGHALSGNITVTKTDVSLGNVDNTSDATKNAATATLTNKTLTSPVINTPTGLVKGDVGLGNVDNTSDANKPVSTATTTALNLKMNLAGAQTVTGAINFTGGLSSGGTAVVVTSDSRLSDARTPTAHKVSHSTGGTDALTPANIGALSAADASVTNARNGLAPNFATTTAYKQNQLVVNSGTLYRAVADFTSGGSFSGSDWSSLGGAVDYASLPAGTTLTVIKSGTWPARPTSRSDIIVQWKGADPSPSIVSSGTGGMLDNVDIRLVTP